MSTKFQRSGMFYVYVLECRDGSYYTGYTNDLSARIERHNRGLASKYTRARLPVKLVWVKEHSQFKSAFKAEMGIKGLRRKQKEALVKGQRLEKILEEKKKYAQKSEL